MPRAPALFLSHGSPMMALRTVYDDPYVRILSDLGKRLPKPRAIALVSAHWYGRGKLVSVSAFPETIYDFQGFPRELQAIRYDAPGFPDWAALLQQASLGTVRQAVERGIDHGGWTVLRHLYPAADVPVFSISMDALDTPEQHFAFGKQLGVLREQGIMVLGTGNIVHNLSRIEFASVPGHGSELGITFDDAIAGAIETRDMATLFDPHAIPWGNYSVPTWEHYLPLLVTLGAAADDEKPEWLFEGFEYGSISRRTVGFFGD